MLKYRTHRIFKFSQQGTDNIELEVLVYFIFVGIIDSFGCNL